MAETARIALALRMCPEVHEQRMRDMITAQSDGTVVHGVSLLALMAVRLVPLCWHELLLSSQREQFECTEVFSNQLHEALGAEFHHFKSLEADQTQKMIVLRPVVVAGPEKHKSGVLKTKLGFLVKIFNPPDEVGYMPGLKLGVLFAADMKSTQCTWAPYVEVRNPMRLQTCGANVVLAQPPATSGAGPDTAAVGFATSGKGRPAPPAAQHDPSLSPTLGTSSKHGRKHDGKRDAHSESAPGAFLHAGAATEIVLMDWRPDDDLDAPRVAKRLKADNETGVHIEYDSFTCMIARSPAQINAIKKMTQAEFIAQVVLGGAPISEPPDAGGMALRQHKGNLWYSLYRFWGQSAIKHLSSVLALCLDGHGHGKTCMMNVAVKSQHNGCCGKWDMMTTWAAWALNLFPAKWVCARFMLCC